MTPTTQRKARLLALLASLQASEVPKDALEITKGDFLDEASRVSEQAVTTELLRNRKESILLIKEALKTIDDWDANICGSCNSSIGEKRLQAVPWATRCVSCQEREERNQRDVGEAKRLKSYYQYNENQDAKFFHSKRKEGN